LAAVPPVIRSLAGERHAVRVELAAELRLDVLTQLLCAIHLVGSSTGETLDRLGLTPLGRWVAVLVTKTYTRVLALGFTALDPALPDGIAR
jgi:hypothetical protein